MVKAWRLEANVTHTITRCSHVTNPGLQVMLTALIGLGANLQSPAQMLDDALHELEACPHVVVQSASARFTTRPAGGPADQMQYVNAAARLETTLSADELFRRLVDIEDRLGRQRNQRWGPRTIDLDLLLYDDLVLESPRLNVPHSRMSFRRFVLEPAVEIAGDLVHPLIGWTVERICNHLKNSPPYFAIAGPDAASRFELARRVSDRVAGRSILTGHDLRSPLEFSAQPLISDFWEVQERRNGKPVGMSLPRPRLVVELDVTDPFAPLPDGPSLQVTSRDMPWAVEEVVAAIQASTE